MISELKGRGLFVFSDPGGAKPILALVETLGSINHKAISDRCHSFFKEFKVDVAYRTQLIIEEIENFKPDYIFTGTSYTSKIELEYLNYARAIGIKSYSFVDHMTSISSRFLLRPDVYVFPDVIFLINEQAKVIAINEGKTVANLKVIENPYQVWLKNWRPLHDKTQFISQLPFAAEMNSRFILYAPDPISNINGIVQFGFDEQTLTSELFREVSKNENIFEGWFFLIKPHPNQDITKLTPLLKGSRIFKMLDESADTNSCIYFSELVVGFFSSILLEAEIIGRKVIRCLPKHVKSDPFENLNVGMKCTPQTFIDKFKLLTN